MTATASVIFSKGHTGVHSSVSDQVFHELVLKRGDEDPQGDHRPLQHRLPRVERVGVRGGEGRDAVGRVPRHVVSVTANGEAVAPRRARQWKAIRLWRQREAGRSADERPAARGPARGGLRAKWRMCDFEGATQVLCAHADDDELWSAAIAQMLRHLLVDSEREPLNACLDPRRPALRDQLLATLRERDAERVGLAAESLAKSTDVSVQTALAEVLTRGAPTERTGCWSTAKVTWALECCTTTLGSAEASTRKALLDVARAPAACPDELTGKAARVYAVAALGVVKDESLRELAATCPTEHAPWKLTFTKWNEAMYANLTNEPLECLAKPF